MKPKSLSESTSTWCLPALTFICLGAVPALHAETWDVAAPAGVHAWNDPLNWLGDASFPNAIDASALLSNNLLFNGPSGPQLQGTVTLNLNGATTLGNLTMGDLSTTSGTFQGNGFFNVQNGTGGSLTFDVTAGNATLQKTAGSGTTDTLSATTILGDTLAADVRTGTINVTGLVSGTGGIIRSGSVSGAVTSAGGTLGISNNNNSYSGDTTIEHGTVSATLNGDILVSTNSVLGNSANAVAIGLATTPAAATNGSSTLTFVAGSDAANYVVSRGLDFSQGPSTPSNIPNATLNFNGNGAGVPNTNTLTLAGTLTFGARPLLIGAGRGGMTVDITGPVVSPPTGAGSIRWNAFPPDPGATIVDGRGSGTVRFSNLARTFTNGHNLTMGTIIIDGDVPATGPSPIGTQGLALSVGTGGNIVGGGNFAAGAGAIRDISPDTTRSLFLQSAGTTYARALAPGNGTITVATGVTGATTGTTAIPASYGTASGAAATDADRVSVINGFVFGGLNTSGTVTFSGAINSGSPTVGSHPTNVIETAINMALIAQTGGTVVFGGNITDTTSATTHTRVTINQFRNHPNIDGSNNTTNVIGADGVIDATANTLVGTATGGTVVLNGVTNSYQGTTEVLGGTLLVNGTHNGSGSYTVASGATLGGSGTIDLIATGGNVVLQAGAALDPGSSAVAGGTLILNLGTGQLDLSAVAGGMGYLRYGLATPATSDKVQMYSGPANIGSGLLDLDDFAFSNISLTNGTHTLIETAEPITGTLGSNLTAPLFGGSATLSIGDGGTDLILTVTGVVNDYGTWASSFSLVQGAGGDDDGDGLTNEEEYIFGLVPNSGASVNPFASPLNKGTGMFSYTRRLPSLTGRAFTYQYSTGLSGWLPLTPVSENTDSENPTETITVTVPANLLDEPKLFVRVIGQ